MAMNKLKEIELKERNNNIIKLRKEGNTLISIAKMVGLSYSTIKSICKKSGLAGKKKRSKNINANVNYFVNIDNSTKAYLLGLLHADGYITTSIESYNGTRSSVIGLGLSYPDNYLIEHLKSALNLSNKINVAKAKKETHNDYYEIKTGIKQIVSSLSDIKDPNLIDRVPTEFHGDFIRGYFDGNGCIYYSGKGKYKSKRWKSYVCGPNNIMNKIYEVYPLYFNTPAVDSKSPSMSRMSIKQDQLLNFFNFIYLNSMIYMRRKKHKFEDYVLSHERSETQRETSHVDEDRVQSNQI